MLTENRSAIPTLNQSHSLAFEGRIFFCQHSLDTKQFEDKTILL
jgi:hypothetical protein